MTRRPTLRESGGYGAIFIRRVVTITFAIGTVTIIDAGCSRVHYDQAESGHAAMQRDVDSPPSKPLPTSATSVQTKPFRASELAAEATGNSDIASNSSESSAANDGWQYCFAPSHAEHKIYMSPSFPKIATLDDPKTAFAAMLSQSKIQHDTVQCSIGKDESAISAMRQNAISFNHKVGNTIVDMTWDRLQLSQGEDAVSDNIITGYPRIITGNPRPNGDTSTWQYCLAPSNTENKVYISPAFPESAAPDNAATGFGKMLAQSEIKHDVVECPIGKDKSSIASMRAGAISFNQQVGKTIIPLNWKP